MKQRIRKILEQRLAFPPLDGLEFLMSREVGRFLRVSRYTLKDWRRNGTGPPFIRIGHVVVRYPVRALRRYLRQHLHGGLASSSANTHKGVATKNEESQKMVIAQRSELGKGSGVAP
jgi:hypothetical protein